MKKETCLFWLILNITFFLFLNCSKDPNSYQIRLNNFKKLLSSEIRQQFEQGQSEVVSDYLNEQASKDKEFKKKFNTIKDFESINFFNEIQVVNYFYDHFEKKLNN